MLALFSKNKVASKWFGTAKKKTIAKAIVFFSYIRLRRVIFLRSDIRLKPSDIALRAVLVANIISLKPQVSISRSQRENITPTKSEYH